RALEPAGVALVDKPAGPSSFAIVAQIRRMTGARTGHAGTLDPFATGLLLVLSGRATKIAPCLVGLDKRYLTDVDLTARTSTGDPEGELGEPRAAPDAAELDRRLEALRGEIELPIPAASAVKIGGERAYRLARRGVEVEMPLRRSTVHALDVIAYTGDLVTLDLRVSSGTYVRAIAEALGGHCRSLRRTEVGPFSVHDAVVPDAFEPGLLLPEAEVLERVGAAAEGFRFGHGRAGDLALLERLGFEVRRVPLLDGVSSSRIRKLLSAGDVEQAAQLLGRPPEVEGIVVLGDQRGRLLGFPTANL